MLLLLRPSNWLLNFSPCPPKMSVSRALRWLLEKISSLVPPPADLKVAEKLLYCEEPNAGAALPIPHRNAQTNAAVVCTVLSPLLPRIRNGWLMPIEISLECVAAAFTFASAALTELKAPYALRTFLDTSLPTQRAAQHTNKEHSAARQLEALPMNLGCRKSSV